MSPFEKHLREWAASASMDLAPESTTPVDETDLPAGNIEIPSLSDSMHSATTEDEPSEEAKASTSTSQDIPSPQNAEFEPAQDGQDGGDDGSGRQWGTPFRVRCRRVSES